MSWNDERVELLKKLWSDGLSASQIAGRLGGVTRNAVIGKVHRLGLSGRATTSRMKSHRPRTRPQVASNVPAEELEIPLKERKYIQTLTENCCRWPIGDPQLPDFHFCGKKKVAGLPYCEVHARRAFQPPQPRRRDRSDVSVPAIAAATRAPAEPVPADAEQDGSEKITV